MSSLSNARELKEDVLFRASEPLTTSQWDSKVMDYLNRVYRTLSAGASEFLPEFVDDWWWMRASDQLLLEPSHATGTLALVNGSASITFSSAPSISLQGRRLRVLGNPGTPDIFVIEAHTAGQTNATLDLPYTGDTNAAAEYTAMKTVYSLGVAVQVLMSPIVGYKGNDRIFGISPEKMDELYPLRRLTTGIPLAFALEDERTVRFSHGGLADGRSMRIDYRYRPFITDLTDSTGSVPLVPTQWMHVLSDMALVYVLLDKNDDRSNAAALGARTGLAAMLKENRRRSVKVDQFSGHISPRGKGSPGEGKGPLRTDSGLIIG